MNNTKITWGIITVNKDNARLLDFIGLEAGGFAFSNRKGVDPKGLTKRHLHRGNWILFAEPGLDKIGIIEMSRFGNMPERSKIWGLAKITFLEDGLISGVESMKIFTNEDNK